MTERLFDRIETLRTEIEAADAGKRAVLITRLEQMVDMLKSELDISGSINEVPKQVAAQLGIDPSLYDTPYASRLVRTARVLHYNRNKHRRPWLRVLSTEPVFRVGAVNLDLAGHVGPAAERCMATASETR